MDKERTGRTSQPIFEALEPRLLLSGELISAAGQYEASASLITPAWFEDLSTLPAMDASAESALYVQQEPREIEWKGQTVEVSEPRWIVQFDAKSVREIASVSETVGLFSSSEMDFEVIRGLGMAGQILVGTHEADVEDVVEWFGANPNIAFFEPDAVLTIEAIPDDADFSQLWGMHNTGQTGGTPDADIDAPEAWDIATGGSGIVVGIIDTGIDYNHPDLAANIWTNPGEIAANGIDDDGNGFVDDIHGYDFVNNDGDPMDDNRHGTHCAGTIAAVGNNERGVAGVNWSSSLMAIKFLDSGGGGWTSDAVRAINYATMMKAGYGVDIRVTSNSWGGGRYEQSLHDAIAAAGEADILFVAAAGNDSSNNDASPHYPSNYGLDNVIAVAATDHNDSLASFSCYGPTSVDLAAPGVSVYSTTPGDGYASLSGTSMATPHVSGTAALAWSCAPNATAEQIRDVLFAGVDPIGSLAGRMVTGGRLNARRSLEQLGMSVARSTPQAEQIISVAPTDFTIQFTHAYAPDSVQAHDLEVDGRPADECVLEDEDTVFFSFHESPVTADGPQLMQISAGAVARRTDGDPIGAWQAAFYYDTLPMTVTSTSPAEGETVTYAPPAETPVNEIVLDFNEAISAGTAGVDDLILSHGSVTHAVPVDSDSVRYSVAGLVRDGEVIYTLREGALLDAHGTPGPSYAGHFTLDNTRIDRFPSSDIPKDIRDLATIASTIEIDELLIVADAEVELDITHSWDSDLDVFLIAPDGTRVELFTDVGAGGDNFTGTVLDDEAEAPIATASAPFSGRYRPEGLLSDVNGYNALGTWALEVSDDYLQDQGTLNRWALLIERDIDIEPRISSVQPLPCDGGLTWKTIQSLAVRFSEEMAPTPVNDTANWLLAEAGPDGVFDTDDDVPHPLSVSPAYSSGLNAILVVDAGPLPVGAYRLTTVSDGLVDLLGNPLDGDADGTGGDDYVRYFTVMPKVDGPPFAEDFESGALPDLGGYWEFSTDESGRIRVSPALGLTGANTIFCSTKHRRTPGRNTLRSTWISLAKLVSFLTSGRRTSEASTSRATTLFRSVQTECTGMRWSA